MVRALMTAYFLVFLGVKAEYFESVLDDMMTVGWDINESTEEITITMKCQLTSGYCAFGHGSSRMSGSDIYAVTFSGSTASVKDYFSTGHDGIDLDSSDSGLSSITTISSTVSSSSVEVVFSRKLDTGDSKDNIIVANEETSIIWAYVEGSSGVVDHGNKACNIHLGDDTLTWTVADSSISESTSSESSQSSSVTESSETESSGEDSDDSETESSESSESYILIMEVGLWLFI